MSASRSELPKVEQPEGLTVQLFPHQLTTIHAMEELERERRVVSDNIITETSIGINANISGFGKTYEMVGLVLRDQMEWDLEEPHKKISHRLLAGQRIIRKRVFGYIKIPTTLIVVSPSHLQQWKDSFNETNLEVATISNRQSAKQVKPEYYSVVIVVSTFFNNFVDEFNDCAWKRFIFDDPAEVKIPSMREVEAGFIWLVTKNPDGIDTLYGQSNMTMLCDIPSNISTTYKSLVIKMDPDFVRDSWKIPRPTYKYYRCYDPILGVLKGIASQQIIDMISAGNISGAVGILGGDETSNVIDLVMSQKTSEMEYCEEMLERCLEDDEDKESIEEFQNRIFHLNEQMKTLKTRFEEMFDEPCAICSGELRHPVMETNCHIITCGNCMMRWVAAKKTCPMCRAHIKEKSLIYIKKDDSETSNTKTEKGKTKFETLEEIIHRNSDTKVIIFSEYYQTFDMIREFLTDTGISFTELKGSVKIRERNISLFKSGERKVLFLNSGYNGAGLNLQEATDLVFYHKISEDTRENILSRVNRVGKTDSVTVHHLFEKRECDRT